MSYTDVMNLYSPNDPEVLASLERDIDDAASMVTHPPSSPRPLMIDLEGSDQIDTSYDEAGTGIKVSPDSGNTELEQLIDNFNVQKNVLKSQSQWYTLPNALQTELLLDNVSQQHRQEKFDKVMMDIFGADANTTEVDSGQGHMKQSQWEQQHQKNQQQTMNTNISNPQECAVPEVTHPAKVSAQIQQHTMNTSSSTSKPQECAVSGVISHEVPELVCKAKESEGRTLKIKMKNGANKLRLPYKYRSRPEKKFHLGNQKYVSVTTFRGEKKVHVRQFYTNDKAKTIPTKKGITLSLKEWKEMTEMFTSVNTEINTW
ncbi:uncharacterized protein [Amphiura filiformis]|uniref:uncharacterized protein n=1 Tax=Amphiura filiformis TaxID=82378 RepID=UPI003B21017D